MQVVVSTVAGGSSTASTSTLAGASGVVNAQGLSSLALGVDVTQVAEYIRSGNDLLIVLENGEIITVNGYFAAPVPPDLYLMDGVEAVEAGMEGAAQGAVHPQFAQVANMAANPAVSAVAQAAVATGSVSGGLIAGGIAVAAGAGAAIAVSSDDNDDDGDSVDTGEEPPFEPPLEPLTLSNLSVLQNEDGSLTISGLATPGTVAHITLSDGTTVEGYVTDDGTFTVVWTPDNSSLPNGSITVHVSDGERTSEPGTVDYVDTLAPDLPVISYLLTDAGMLAEGPRPLIRQLVFRALVKLVRPSCFMPETVILSVRLLSLRTAAGRSTTPEKRSKRGFIRLQPCKPMLTAMFLAHPSVSASVSTPPHRLR